MYKSKYANLMQHLMNEHNLILLDSEQQEIEKWLNKDLKAINYSQCCTQLKDKEATAFDLWLKNFEYAESVDSFWFEKDMLLCRDEMKLRYNEIKPNL